MKTLLALIMTAVLLSGCASWFTKKDEPVAIKYKYIVNTIPAEMLTPPPPTYKIDPTSATDKDAARWMIDSEQRYMEIEKKLNAIKALQEERMNSLKIPPEDIIKN